MKQTNRKGTSLLIERVVVNGTLQDIFVDETGTIASVGEGTARAFRSEAETSIDGAGDLALPGPTVT